MTAPATHAQHLAIDKARLTKAINSLLGIVAGVLADGALHDREIQFLSTWLTENTEVAAVWPGSIIAQQVRDALADGHIDEAERTHLLQALEQLTRTDFSQTGATTPETIALPYDQNGAIVLAGAKVCLTGEFLFGTRTKCQAAAEAAGAIIRNSVTRQTDLVIVGSLISPNWAHTSFGRKIQEAIALQEGGADLRLITEQRWTMALN